MHCEERPHRCDECSATFKKSANLKRHIGEVHGKGAKFACNVCGKSFMSVSKLNVHLAGHSDERNIKCDQCDKSYKTKKALYNHKIGAHVTEKPFQCEVCLKSFAMACFLKVHSKRHSEERPHKCEECSATFKEPKDLKLHQGNVHGKGGKFACDICGKSVMSMTKLNVHLIVHSDEKNFKCDKCGKFYKSKDALINHERSAHATERSFQCEVCSKSFATATYLKMHSVRHIEERPYKCDECFAAFKEPKDLKCHLNQVHGKGLQFACKVCGKSFMTEKKLNFHLARHNDERSFKCDQCDKSYRSKNDLYNHKMFVHATERPFKCDVCFKSFSTASFLKQHKKCHSKNKPHKCEECSASFKEPIGLKRHLCEVHGKGAKFACNVCGKSFISVNKLNKHLIRHGDETHKVKIVEMLDEVDVKVEPVLLYDPEVKQVISDEIKVEMNADVKEEPQDMDEF